MFSDRILGCEFAPEVNAANGTAIGLQPVRLSTPIQGGAWAIPSFHPEIPPTIRGESGVAQQFLADFGLSGNSEGVPLPKGTFTTMADTLKKQWSHYILSATKGHESDVNLRLEFIADSKGIKANVDATSGLGIYRMRSLVERLNQECEGLGWWVLECAQASAKDGFPIYDLPKIADLYCDGRYGCELTDKDYLRQLNDMEGGKRKSKEQWKKEQDDQWPSEFIDCVGGGHAWVFRARNAKGKFLYKQPYIASLDEANAYVQNAAADASLKAAVSDFLALQAELGRKDSLFRQACPDQRADPYDEDWTDYLEPIGASCALVWDEVDSAFEAIQHYEERAMNGGDSTCTFLVYTLNSREPEAVQTFTQSLKDFVQRYAAISKAFSHFDSNQ